MTYETARLELKTIQKSDLGLLRDYLVRNRTFLSEWEPERNDSYYSENELLRLIDSECNGNQNKTQLSLYISLKGENRIIGNVTLSNIIQGVFQSSFIGYKLDYEEINNGYITEALEKIINIAFNDLKLHRIEANIMPRNIRSIKVIQKLGFEYEGLSKRYLKIQSVWEDHAHYAKLNENQ